MNAHPFAFAFAAGVLLLAWGLLESFCQPDGEDATPLQIVLGAALMALAASGGLMSAMAADSWIWH